MRVSTLNPQRLRDVITERKNLQSRVVELESLIRVIQATYSTIIEHLQKSNIDIDQLFKKLDASATK